MTWRRSAFNARRLVRRDSSRSPPDRSCERSEQPAFRGGLSRYSLRMIRVGSQRTARRAGMKQAKKPVSSSVTETVT